MANTSLKKVFHVPLTKGYKDNGDGTISVTGKFTSDQKDEVGDIITRAATERAIPRYRQWGNVRLMHLPKPVGKVIKIGEEDGLEWNEVEIKVVDPDTIRDVRHDLLPALSIGAMISFDDIDFMEDGGWLINDYSLAEISLVDHPANYDAKLDLAALPSDFRDAVRNEGFAMAVKSYGISDMIERPEKTEKIIEEETGDDTPLEPVEEIEMEVQEELQEVPEEVLAEVEVQTEKELPVAEEEPAIVEEPATAELPAVEPAEEVEQFDAEPAKAIEETESEEELDLREVLAEVLNAIKALAPAEEVPAEAPEIEEQTENESEVATEEDALLALYSLVENLEEKVVSMGEEIERLRKPAERKGAVIPAEAEEETEAEVERSLETEEPEEAEEPTLHKALKSHFRATGRM